MSPLTPENPRSHSLQKPEFTFESFCDQIGISCALLSNEKKDELLPLFEKAKITEKAKAELDSLKKQIVQQASQDQKMSIMEKYLQKKAADEQQSVSDEQKTAAENQTTSMTGLMAGALFENGNKEKSDDQSDQPKGMIDQAKQAGEDILNKTKTTAKEKIKHSNLPPEKQEAVLRSIETATSVEGIDEVIGQATGAVAKAGTFLMGQYENMSDLVKHQGPMGAIVYVATNIFESIIAFFKNLFNGIHDFFNPKTQEEKDKEASENQNTGAEESLEKSDQKVPAKTPEEEEKEREEVRQALEEDLQKKFLPYAKPEKIEILKEEAKKMSNELLGKFKDVAGKVEKGEEWNALYEVAGVPYMMAKFSLSLMAKGVISVKSLGIEFVQGAVDTYMFIIQAPFNVAFYGNIQGLPVGEISKEQVELLPKEQKEIFQNIASNQTLPAARLAGDITKLMAKIPVIFLAWEQGTGFTQVRSGLNALIGNTEKAAEQIRTEMLKIHTSHGSPQTKNIAAFDTVVQETLNDIKIKTQAVSALHEISSSTNVAKISTEIDKILTSTTPPPPEELSKIFKEMKKNLPKLGGDLTVFQEFLKNESFKGKFTKYIKGTPFTTAPVKSALGVLSKSVAPGVMSGSLLENITRHIQQSHSNFANALSEHVVNPKNFRLYTQGMLGLKGMDLIRSIEKGYLPVSISKAQLAKGGASVKAALQQILKTVPGGVGNFVTGALPVALIINDLNNEDDAAIGEKIAIVLKDLAYFTPFVGGTILLLDGAQMKGGMPQNIASLTLGGAVIGYDAWVFSKNISHYGGITKAIVPTMFAPIRATASTLGTVLRAPQYGYHAIQAVKHIDISTSSISKAGKAFAAKAFKGGHTGNWRLWAPVAAATLVGVGLFEYFQQEDESIARLKHLGIVDEDGNLQEISEEKMGEILSKLSPGEKGSILNTYLQVHEIPFTYNEATGILTDTPLSGMSENDAASLFVEHIRQAQGFGRFFLGKIPPIGISSEKETTIKNHIIQSLSTYSQATRDEVVQQFEQVMREASTPETPSA